MNLDWYKSLDLFKKGNKIGLILFVCSGNTCRSPAAEYYFKKTMSWKSDISAFSRGTEVEKTLAFLKSKGINIEKLMIEPESKKVFGDKESKFLSEHVARQISSADISNADLVLTMEKSVRDYLRAEYPAHAFKIFTLKGFVEQNDGGSIASLDIGNPFIPPAIRKKEGVTEGKVAYYKYLQNYAKIFTQIEAYTRGVAEIVISINEAIEEQKKTEARKRVA